MASFVEIGRADGEAITILPIDSSPGGIPDGALPANTSVPAKK
jgi:hypothetical protein